MNKKPGTFNKGHIPWNKGLTKIDPRVEQYGLKGSLTKLKLSRLGKLPIPWNKGLTKSKDARLMKVSLVLTGIKRSPESIEKSRINAGKKIREQYKNGERHWWGYDPKNKLIWEKVKEKFGNELSRQKAFAALRKKPNGLEKYLIEILEKNFLGKWRFTGNQSITIGGKFPDFVHINDKKVILLNGLYWHIYHVNRGNLTRQEIEKIERKPYEDFGYRVLHIWEDELISRTKGGKPIFDKNINDVLDKIKQFDII